jgi:Abortive infection C-terminus
MQRQIPVPLIAVVAAIFDAQYTHTQIESRFFAAGFPAPAPAGNKQQKCHNWLLMGNQSMEDPLRATGKLIEEIMEVVAAEWGTSTNTTACKERLSTQLTNLGLSYQQGGHIVHLGSAVAVRTLDQMIKDRDLAGVQREFDRIFSNLDKDPGAALTAACALMEALFKSLIADEGLTLPADQSILPLWKTVRNHLSLDPGEMTDEGLKKVLSGLASIIDGIASLRTKQGSAHGHDVRETRYRVEARHARLAAHAALSLATFLIEVAHARQQRPTKG